MQRIFPPVRAWGLRLVSLATLVAVFAIVSDSAAPAPVQAVEDTGGYCMHHPAFSNNPTSPPAASGPDGTKITFTWYWLNDMRLLCT